jgi:hypothetical protein
MPTRHLPAFLSATIDSVLVSLGRQTPTTLRLTDSVSPYKGERLYCTAAVANSVLTITVTDIDPGTPLDGGTTPNPDGDATTIVMNVLYKQQTFRGIQLNNVFYKAGTSIALGMTLNTDWTTGTLSLVPKIATAIPDELQYIVVFDPSTSNYDMYWVKANARFDLNNVTGATIIPDDPGGGMSGPFGIAMP